MSSIIEKAERYVRELLTDQLTDDHKYHNLPHTLAVRTACLQLGREIGLSSDDLEALQLAALFHDTGFTQTYNGHEDASREIVRQFLEQENYPEAGIQKIIACIEVTYPPNRPTNALEEIIRDADLIHLGSDGYSANLEALRHEWSVFLGQVYSEEEWYKLNYRFLKNQSFFTDAAKSFYGSKRDMNLKYLKKRRKAFKKDTPLGESLIQGNRSAQMMFKTALRNHLDLANLADNKANIMLSVNALIITLVIPLTVRRIAENPTMIYPLGMLLVTCLVSMIYATLATRPIKMPGNTAPVAIEKGASNLFFFGNFFKMDYDVYKANMRKVLENDTNLDDSIMRDLFFLGKSLGRKYALLRLCYTIFMIGIVFTVGVFLFTVL